MGGTPKNGVLWASPKIGTSSCRFRLNLLAKGLATDRVTRQQKKSPELRSARPKNSCFASLRCFSGCFSAVSPALCPGPIRHPSRLFFGCFQGPAFRASRADRNLRIVSPLLLWGRGKAKECRRYGIASCQPSLSANPFSKLLVEGLKIGNSQKQLSRGIKGGQTKWDKRSQIRSFSQIFADFR